MTVSSADALDEATKQLEPTLTGGHAQGGVVVAEAGATKVVQDRLIRLSGVSAGDALLSQPTVWLKPFLAHADQDDSNGVSGFNGWTAGLAAGIDARVTNALRAGAAVSYAYSDIDGNSGLSGVTLHTAQVTAYGSYDIDHLTHVDFLGAFGWNFNDSARQINFGGLNRTAEAEYESWHLISSVELVRSVNLAPGIALKPTVGATYTFARAESYEESGAGAANLSVASTDADSLDLAVGSRVVVSNSDALHFTGSLGVAYDVLADGNQVTAALQGGGSAFVTESIEPEAFTVSSGLGVEWTPASGVDASLTYDIDARSDYLGHSLQLNVRLPL